VNFSLGIFFESKHARSLTIDITTLAGAGGGASLAAVTVPMAVTTCVDCRRDGGDVGGRDRREGKPNDGRPF
jgi:hypothetical protein